MSNSRIETKTYGGVASFVKGLIVSFIITFVGIIFFAFAIKWFELSDSVISPVNLVIKGVSIGLGTFIFVRKSRLGLLKGVLFSLTYTIVAFVLFSLLAGSFAFSVSLVIDLLFAMLVGAVFGIICVSTKK